MKKVFRFIPVLVCLLYGLIVLTVFGVQLNADTAKKSSIYFPEPVFNFGSVYQGEEVTHAFKFQNVGSDTLEISRVQASCGCSKAEVSAKEIAPGEFGQVEVVFKTGGFAGEQTKTISVFSNDPLNPTIQLKLTGKVKIEVEVAPLFIPFGDIPKRTQVTKQFKIIQRGEQEPLIEKIATDKDYLKIDSVEKKEEAGKNVYLVTVVLNNDAPAGSFSGTINIITNLERQKNISVRVSGKVLGDIKLLPEQISLRIPAGVKGKSSVVLSTEGDNFEILKVESTTKYISAEIFTLEKFRKYRLDFSVSEKRPPGIINGQVKVYTNCPGETELAIPVFCQTIEKTIEIGYFFERGCLSCERVHNIFRSLKTQFPAIVLKEYDIESRENIKLNEALCEIYGVPEDKKMLTPTVFIGNDFLIGESITKEKLVELISKHKEGGASLPLKEAVQKENGAEESIADRFRSFGAFAIIGAGLLDGVNPCAFATIIFLVSYFTILKRKGRELIVVGIVFTAAVFITYFLIGIGIFEFLKYLSFLKTFTKFVYMIVGAFTLILGVLSLIDYFKCKKGKAKESLLQLPSFLKKRIHSTIKEQAGLKRYVLAAFVTGFIVSILELSCTGQVYLPTIVYATGISDLRFVAYMYLLLYNIMFITPLVVIFILAYWGTTAVELSDILGKNIALIKLLMAILFFIFTAFLVIMLIV